MKSREQLKSEFGELLIKASGGNNDALRCCQLAMEYFHYFDDLVDGDIQLSAETLVMCNNILLKLTLNPFFQANQTLLAGVLFLVADDYVASETEPAWKMLRHTSNNFIRVVALLTGGENLMKVVGKQLRAASIEAHYDEKNNPI